MSSNDRSIDPNGSPSSPPKKSEAASRETVRHCAFCLKLAECKTCSGCKKRSYCSKECQKNDWKADGPGQGHKFWCKVECCEEDLDWHVVEVPGKGFGVVALRFIPAKSRIMVDRGLNQMEAKSRPQMMDLYPADGDFDKKFQVNQVSSDDGSIVCLRLSRVNHACVGNAGHFYNEGFKVKVLFSDRDIQPGEEITYSYMTHRSTQYNYSPELIEATLKASWGISCPEDCPCKKPETWEKVRLVKKLDAMIPFLYSQMKLAQCYKTCLQMENLYDELQMSLPARMHNLFELFQFAICRESSMKKGLDCIKECRQIEYCLEPFKTGCMSEQYLEEPFTHPNYLMLDRMRF